MADTRINGQESSHILIGMPSTGSFQGWGVRIG